MHPAASDEDEEARDMLPRDEDGYTTPEKKRSLDPTVIQKKKVSWQLLQRHSTDNASFPRNLSFPSPPSISVDGEKKTQREVMLF